MERIFTCENLNKNLSGFRLEDVNLELSSGEILGVIGTNGCGKTTLLRCIMGSYRLRAEGDSGKLMIKGIDFESRIKEYKNELAWIMQDQPFGNYVNVGMAGELYGRYYKSYDPEKFKKLLSDYEINPEMYINKLSTGQQMRLQLAFALSHDASLYVFDEPTGNLDVDFRDDFYKTFREIVSDEKHSVIIATHLVEELESFADRILWLYREGDCGKVRFFGSIDELRDRYRVVEADNSVLIEIPDKAIAGKISRAHSKKVLVDVEKYTLSPELWENSRMADLREIMYFIEKEIKNR